jgi:hypothetical protein
MAAALDRRERERDDFRRQAQPHDHPVGHPAGQLQRARALGRQVDRHATSRAVDLPRATGALHRLATRELS